jgi:hypothetical protein
MGVHQVVQLVEPARRFQLGDAGGCRHGGLRFWDIGYG